MGALSGGSLVTVIAWPLLGTIIENWGWIWAFHIPAIVCVIWSIIWFLTVTNTPENHPWISEKEKTYIKAGLGNKIRKTRVNLR